MSRARDSVAQLRARIAELEQEVDGYKRTERDASSLTGAELVPRFKLDAATARIADLEQILRGLLEGPEVWWDTLGGCTACFPPRDGAARHAADCAYAAAVDALEGAQVPPTPDTGTS